MPTTQTYQRKPNNIPLSVRMVHNWPLLDKLELIKKQKQSATAQAVILPSFKEFILGAWKVLEPATPFVDGWVVDAICDHLTAVSSGDIRKLIINVPPGSMKSLLSSVMWPAWDWLHFPWRRFLTASYAQTLATRDSLKSRRLIQSEWYQSNWGSIFSLVDDQNQKTRYENNHTGFRLATSVGGGTGERAHVRILDDPHNIDTVESNTVREAAVDWVRTVWAEREADAQTSIDIVIMQRLHTRDVCGYLLKEVGGYTHLKLPMEFNPNKRSFTKELDWHDPRTKAGELLWPERFPKQVVADKIKRLGPYGAAGQLAQEPSPRGGGIFKAKWWRFWAPAGIELPPVRVFGENEEEIYCPVVSKPDIFQWECQSWDCAFKAKEDNSLVAGQVWGFYGADCFLEDEVNEHLDIIGTMDGVRRFTTRYPRAIIKLIEAKANGPAVIQILKSEIPGLVECEVEGDKVARAYASTPYFAAGNIYLPHPELPGFSWVWQFMADFESFPKAATDRIDATTQLINRLSAPVTQTEAVYNPVRITNY